MSSDALNDEHVQGLIDAARRLQIGPSAALVIERMTDTLGTRVNWLAFGRIPAGASQNKRPYPRRWLHSATRIGKEYAFLSERPTLSQHERWLDQQFGEGTSTVFGFLCLSRAIPLDQLRNWAGLSVVNDLTQQGLVVSTGDQAVLALRLVPFGSRFYLGDATLVCAYGPAAGIRPAHISEQTYWGVRWLKQELTRRGASVQRILEMGSGIGVGILELAGLVSQRVGAEINSRNLAFALANRVLRKDPDAEFSLSDLFSALSGDFDLIFFNPWQPTVQYLEVVSRFLDESVHRLRKGGTLALWVATDGTNDEDEPVLQEARRFARMHGLVIDRDIIGSYLTDDPQGQLELVTISCLVFDRGERRRLVRTRPSLAVPLWEARRAFVAIRRGRFPT